MSDPFRRVVTGHDADGRAIIVSDQFLTPTAIPSGDANFALVWTSAVLPADNNDDSDGRSRSAGLTLHGGSVVRVVDMLPGKASPLHRTNSLDYGIVLRGTVELLLDDGSVTLVGTGDVVVQRGTIHAWRNPDDEVVARVLFVLTEASARVVEGQPLPEIQP
ncbi:cupin domain-containing protein [Sphingomonas sp. PB4P5]|uniref:cupin domain-containing protein n=1 Tax=Parasphingomonas puruogangriensis TaxID=3096155 RepID=UPI002FC7A158